jgi:hypothetical protein
MLSAMEYPHWLMVAGAVLVVLGFIGFAFHETTLSGLATTLSKLRQMMRQTLPGRKARKNVAKFPATAVIAAINTPEASLRNQNLPMSNRKRMGYPCPHLASD